MIGLQGTFGVYLYSTARPVVFLEEGLSDLFFRQSIPAFHYSCQQRKFPCLEVETWLLKFKPVTFSPLLDGHRELTVRSLPAAAFYGLEGC